MKTLLLCTTVCAALFFSTGNAAAFDIHETIERINDADYACFAGESHDGEQITDAEIQAACLELVRLLEEMKSHGYCYDRDAVAWRKCS